MSDIDEPLKPFSSFIEPEVTPEAPSEPVEVEQPTAQEPVAVEPTEEVAEEPQVQTEQESPSPVDPGWINYCKENGFAIEDGLAPEDVYAQTVEALQSGSQVALENERLRQELEALREQKAAVPTPVPPAPISQPQAPISPDSPATAAKERLFRKLSYDTSLDAYVDRNELGQAIPRPEYGQRAIEAAMTINDHELAARRQAELLVNDPDLLFAERMEDIERAAEAKAQSVFDEKIAAWQKEQDEQRQAQEAESRQSQERQQLDSWHETNKSKLFMLTPTGDIQRSAFDQNSYAQTEVGRKFMTRLGELRSDFPGADQIKLMDLALRDAELTTPQTQYAPPAPVKTEAQKRQEKFVQQRQSIPNQEYQPAPVEAVASASPKIRFAEMVRNDPENQGIIGGW